MILALYSAMTCSCTLMFFKDVESNSFGDEQRSVAHSLTEIKFDIYSIQVRARVENRNSGEPHSKNQKRNCENHQMLVENTEKKDSHKYRNFRRLAASLRKFLYLCEKVRRYLDSAWAGFWMEPQINDYGKNENVGSPERQVAGFPERHVAGFPERSQGFERPAESPGRHAGGGAALGAPFSKRPADSDFRTSSGCQFQNIQRTPISERRVENEGDSSPTSFFQKNFFYPNVFLRVFFK